MVTKEKWLSNKSNIIILLVLSIVFCIPIIFSFQKLGIQDWDQYLAYYEVIRKSIFEFSQFPLWNPYICGGLPLIADPQNGIVSLNTILVLIFGTIFGIKISILLHYFINVLGCYLLSKHFKLSNYGALIASIIYGFSGVMSSALGTGMIPFLSYSYLPLSLYFYSKSVINNHRLNILLTSLFISLSFYQAYHPLMIFLPFFTFYMLVLLFWKKDWKYLINYVVVILLVFILVSPKLILSMELLIKYPRIINDLSGYTLVNLFQFLVNHNQAYYQWTSFTNTRWYIDENSLYVGLGSLILFSLGIYKLIRDKQWFLIILLVFNLLLIIGNIYPISLYNLLKKIPFYDNFRVAERFRFNFILIFAVIAGVGIDFFNKKNSLQIFKYLIVIILFSNLMIFTAMNFFTNTFSLSNCYYKTETFSSFVSVKELNVDCLDKIDNSQLIKKDKRLESVYDLWSSHYFHVVNNADLIDCYQPIPISIKARGVSDKKYKGEVYLDNNQGIIKVINWTPNRIIIKVTLLKKKDYIVINQNHDNHWFVRVNDQIYKTINYNGLIGFLINQDSTYEFFYNPYIQL